MPVTATATSPPSQRCLPTAAASTGSSVPPLSSPRRRSEAWIVYAATATPVIASVAAR